MRARTEGEFLAWLRQILATVLANQVRKYLGTRRRDVRLERDLEVELDVSSRAIDGALVARNSSPSQQVAREELGVFLAEALAQLPQDYREVIILRQLEDLSFPEVARRLGRTESSVKNLWIRALARLRVLIEEP